MKTKTYTVESVVTNNQWEENYTASFRSETKRGALSRARQNALNDFRSKHDCDQSAPDYTFLDCKREGMDASGVGFASDNGLL